MFGDGGRADGRAARLAGRRRAWGGNPEGEGGALVGRKRTRNGPDPLFPGVKIQKSEPFSPDKRSYEIQEWFKHR